MFNYKKTRHVINKYGTPVEVNWDGNIKLMNYDNERCVVEWNVPFYDDPHSYTDVLVSGFVDDVRLRLETWNNVPKCLTALCCIDIKTEHKERIEEIVATYVLNNQPLFFTKCGNWRKNNYRQQSTAIAKVCKDAIKELRHE